MYGMINEGIRDLVIARGGHDAWREVCDAAGIERNDFDSFAPYPDDCTYSLAKCAAARLRLTLTELLHAFGEHWITYTAATGYGEMMKLFGDDFRSCITNLNRMHAHMGGIMPGLTPPRFVCVEHSPSRLTLHYHSTREGLGPMVQGLLTALAQWFKEPVTITPFFKGVRSDHDEFDLTFAPQ